jgi:large subunit ribosomal protein L25
VLYDPVKSRALHVDFLGVDLDKNIRVSVRFEVAGKAVGVANGGVLEIYRESVDVVCKPLDIPEKILVDVTALDIGDNVHVADVSFPAGVRPVFDENFAVLGVVVPSAVKDEAEAAAAAAAAAEGEVAPAEGEAEAAAPAESEG